MIKATLEDWALVPTERNPFRAPELSATCLTGKVFDHVFHEQGKRIITSPLVGRNEEKVITRSGSPYALGAPATDYEAIHPGCRERLLASLPVLASKEFV